MSEITLTPSEIRFMHYSINPKFRNGDVVEETIKKIEKGQMGVYTLPKIKVVKKNGYYFAFDNRRLYVYRVLQHRGKLDKITVKLAPLSDWQERRYSTTNKGKSVLLKYGETVLPHAHAVSPPPSPKPTTPETDIEVGNSSVASEEVDSVATNDESNLSIESTEKVEVADDLNNDDIIDDNEDDDTVNGNIGDNDLDKVIVVITDPQEDMIDNDVSNISGNSDEKNKDVFAVAEISESSNDDADDSDGPSKPKKCKYDADIVEQSYSECCNSAEKSSAFDSDVKVDNNVVELVNEDMDVERDSLSRSLQISHSIDPLEVEDDCNITIRANENQNKGDNQDLTDNKCDQRASSNIVDDE